jgi:hypothetical protein
MDYKKHIKKLITIYFIFLAFISNGQRTMFGAQNNFVAPVTTTQATVVTTGLILNLNANSYSGSGTTWSDLSSQNNSATLVGNPTFSSNPASFNFAANVIATTTQNNISLTTATFIAWVNPSQTQGPYTGVIFSRSPYGGSSVPATGLDLYTNNSVGYHWADAGATYDWNSNLFVPNNAWSMIAITVSANSAKAYLCNANGITTAINSVSHATLSGLRFYIACDPVDQSLRAFKGKIGTAMVYNTALTSQNITDIFNVQKATFGL